MLDWPPDELAVAFGGMLNLIDDGDGRIAFDDLVPLTEDLPWERVEFEVDGAPTAFQLLRNGPDWLAWAWVTNVLVDLDGRGDGGFPLDQVELVSVPDASAYIEGWRRLW